MIKRYITEREGKDFGACNVKNNTIYISTLAIMKGSTKNNIPNMINVQKEDFLANVILDEITHIVTKCNHGSDKYDKQLDEYKNKYYKWSI